VGAKNGIGAKSQKWWPLLFHSRFPAAGFDLFVFVHNISDLHIMSDASDVESVYSEEDDLDEKINELGRPPHIVELWRPNERLLQEERRRR
jgi:hypothetical protein